MTTGSRTWLTLLASVCLLFWVSTGVWSEVTTSVLSSPQHAAPGEFVTHVFSVTNDALTADTVDIGFAIPPGWGILGAPTELSLAAGEEGTIFVTVTVPPGAIAGTYKITLAATSQSDPTYRASVSATTTVAPVNQISIVMPDAQSAPPGAKVSYDVVIVNRGNVQDTIDVTATSSHKFDVSVSNAKLNLGPQEKATVVVTIQITADAAAGRDVLSLFASSSLYPGVEEDATLFTTVLPPSPQAVGGTLMQELPARLRLSIGQDVFTEEVQSDLTFSVSGGVLDGYLSAYMRLTSVFGPEPVSLGSIAISYRSTPATFTIGDVSRRLTDLLSISCRGGSLLYDDDNYRLALIGGGAEDETRVGLYLAVGPQEAQLGIAHTEARTRTESDAVWSFTAAAEPLDDWTLRVEGALGLSQDLTSRAFFFNTTIDTVPYFLSGEVFSVGSYFPGQRSDSAGIALSQRLRHNDFSLAASITHVWDNTNHNPALPTTIDDNLGLNMSATPLTDGPTLNTTVEFNWTRNADLTLQNSVSRLVSFQLGNTGNTFQYSFTGKLNDQIDHTTSISYRTLTFSEGGGLSFGDIDLFLTLVHTKTIDLATNDLVAGGTTVSFRFRSNSSLHSATISLTNDVDAFTLSAKSTVEIFDNLSLRLTADMGWDRADASPATFSWGMMFDWRFDLPLPFLVTKGRIEGHVFVDRDGDGAFTPGDTPVAGAVLQTDRSAVSTDKEGRYRFPPFAPGTYAVSASGLPLTARLASEPTVALAAGETAEVDLALTPVTVLSGVLFDDANKNGVHENDEGGFAQVRIVLSDGTGDTTDTYSGIDGGFTFTDVVPATYTVSVDQTSLPERFVFTTDKQVTLTVGADSPSLIGIGGYIKPKQIIMTFQPPTADFTFTPMNPSAGTSVSFDASDSFDFDGEVVRYDWDFDGDGKSDATGVAVEKTFPSSGSYDVTLTITDNEGNTDSITYTVDVK